MYTVEDAINALSDDLTTLEAQIEAMETRQLAQTERAKVLGYERVIDAARNKKARLVQTQTAYIDISVSS